MRMVMSAQNLVFRFGRSEEEFPFSQRGFLRSEMGMIIFHLQKDISPSRPYIGLKSPYETKKNKNFMILYFLLFSILP